MPMSEPTTTKLGLWTCGKCGRYLAQGEVCRACFKDVEPGSVVPWECCRCARPMKLGQNWCYTCCRPGIPTDQPKIEQKPDLLAEAAATIKERQANYDHPAKNFARIAKMWSAILDVEVTAKDVALMMIALKITREKHAHDPDNSLDILGYKMCLEQLEETTD